jgi:hypothetical protein
MDKGLGSLVNWAIGSLNFWLIDQWHNHVDKVGITDGAKDNGHRLPAILDKFDGELGRSDAFEDREQVGQLQRDRERLSFDGGIYVADAIATFGVCAHHDHAAVHAISEPRFRTLTIG